MRPEEASENSIATHVETEPHVTESPHGVLSKILLLHSLILGNSNSSIEYGPKTGYFVILFIKN